MILKSKILRQWGTILDKLKRRAYFYQAVQIVIGLAIAVLLCQVPMHYLEFFGYDIMTRMRPKTATSDQVRMIGIDSKTFSRLDRLPHLNEHTALLNSIREDHPRAILYLLTPQEINSTHAEQVAFAEAAAKIPHFYVAVNDLQVDANRDKFQLPAPLNKLQLVQGILSEDKVNFAGDGVSRRAIIDYNSKFFVQAKIAQLYTGPIDADKYRGAFEFRGSWQILTNMHPKGSFPSSSFLDVMEKRFPVGQFTDKVVVVGRASDFDSPDFVRTVYSRDITAMSVLEYHANIIDTMIQNDGVIKAPDWVNFALTILVSILTLFITFRESPTRGIVLLLGTIASYFVLAWVLFAFTGYWILVAHPLLAAFITYYFFIPYRLITENKRSWEYQKKHELLLQVEELKNNFISMMSHDLKTPIARIQGMADMALHDKASLNDTQRTALSSIKNSTNELHIFINSILNLSRVESKELKLHLESKDINTIVKDVIEKNKFQADSRGIQILFEAEPLFSIPVDVDLMRQVIHNLIENSIKYSPDGSKILVTTEEKNGEVHLQVADQGTGISEDEVAKIFLKFYRSKDAKASPIKGSGLGLYLSNYFVQLHGGKIQVESVLNQGSTFTVSLPLQ